MLVFHEKTMYQKNMDPRYLTVRNVRRRPLFVSQSALQPHTSYGDFVSSSDHSNQMHEDGDFKRIPLSSDSKEFQDVEAQFHTTISRNKAQIPKIEKIKNDFLLKRYKMKREQMKRKLKASGSSKMERQLFHGTTSEVVNAISKQNFDHRLHGKNGTAYGEGSYFAVKASYSNSYSSGERTRFMFLASVLTGEYKFGEKKLRRPPLKNPQNPASDLYDSSVDNEDKPTIFVIFSDEQCYPSYLITYSV